MTTDKLVCMLRPQRCKGEALTTVPWSLILGFTHTQDSKELGVELRLHFKYFEEAEVWGELKKLCGTPQAWEANATGLPGSG